MIKIMKEQCKLGKFTNEIGKVDLFLNSIQHICNQFLDSEWYEKVYFLETKDTSYQVYLKMKEDISIRIIVYTNPWWKRFSRVIGYVKGKIKKDETGTIYVNSKYFNLNSKKNICSNLIHEVSHLKGYTHSSATSYESVPYKLNTIFKTFCENTGIEYYF